MESKIEFKPKYEYDFTSLLYWFPKIMKIKELNIPDIYIIEFPHPIAFSDDRFKYLKKTEIRKQIDEICDKLGFPLFIKTDFFSGKHGWDKTCFVPNKKVLFNHIWNLFEESDCASINGLPIFALIFRKYIPLFTNFNFFKGNLPINKERRYFIIDNKVQCKHPYWFLEVFKQDFDMKLDVKKRSNLYKTIIGQSEKKFIIEENEKKIKLQDIKNKLKILNHDSKEDKIILNKMIIKVAEIFNDYWSVDFAYGIDGKWYLIDMAKGEVSFHYHGCKFAVIEEEF